MGSREKGPSLLSLELVGGLRQQCVGQFGVGHSPGHEHRTDESAEGEHGLGPGFLGAVSESGDQVEVGADLYVMILPVRV